MAGLQATFYHHVQCPVLERLENYFLEIEQPKLYPLIVVSVLFSKIAGEEGVLILNFGEALIQRGCKFELMIYSI